MTPYQRLLSLWDAPVWIFDAETESSEIPPLRRFGKRVRIGVLWARFL